jgi:hypothetical protein
MQNYFVKENKNYFLFSFPTRRPRVVAGGVADPRIMTQADRGLQPACLTHK